MATRIEILEARQTANEIYRDFNVDDRISAGHTRVDPFEIARLAGVPVLLRELDGLLGAYVNENQPGILINAARPAGLIQMTCGHELGHHFLGHGTTTDEVIDYSSHSEVMEIQADEFAYGLLVPRRLITNVLRKKGWERGHLDDPVIVYQMSLRLGISYAAMINFLKRYQIIVADVANYLRDIKPINIKRELIGHHPSFSAYSDVWLIDTADTELVLEPTPGDVFVIDRKGHAAAGFIWTIQEATREGFQIQPLDLQIAGESELDVEAGGEDLVNYSIFDEFIEAAEDNPTARIFISEERPWTGERYPDSKIDLALEYRQKSTGLERSASRSWLQQRGVAN